MGLCSGIMGGMTAGGAVVGLVCLGFLIPVRMAYPLYALALVVSTPLTWAAAGGHVEALRLLLERGASGAAALHATKSDEMKALLREHGATLTLPEECRAGNTTAIATLLDGDAEWEGAYLSAMAMQALGIADAPAQEKALQVPGSPGERVGTLRAVWALKDEPERWRH